MELLTSEDFLKDKNVIQENMPFCLQRDYLSLYSSIEILRNGSLYAPIKRQSFKKFKTMQFQFAPVDHLGEKPSPEQEKEFCNDVVSFCTDNKITHRIIQPVTHSLFSESPENCIKIPFGTYRIDLNLSEEEILKKMQARYRSSINQASQLNPEIRYGISELKKFQELHEETMKRTVNFHESHTTLKSELDSLPKNALLATVYLNNELQGGLYVLYSKFCAFYMHGASSKKTSAQGAIRYLHYKVMCELKKKGVKYYDFVGARLSDVSGTKYEGIQDFKRRFGAELIEGFLWKKDIEPKIARSYDVLLKIKCKLKGNPYPKDIIDQEKNKFKKIIS